MKTQNDRAATAEQRVKKEYKKPVFNTFGRVADLTTSGSAGMNEMGGGQPQKKS